MGSLQRHESLSLPWGHYIGTGVLVTISTVWIMVTLQRHWSLGLPYRWCETWYHYIGTRVLVYHIDGVEHDVITKALECWLPISVV
ncbi:hypothetical protein DPMN_103963 [Dreissena polymorpha]|uniref:Uncharacterized protein n=1 Tax=Dreissena polymorpha TaxID=45954 RepID=A0A9D4HC49_DREPO|nr:hypothetical protein DPMN_103963 [Dreissena polymorpha]